MSSPSSNTIRMIKEGPDISSPFRTNLECANMDQLIRMCPGSLETPLENSCSPNSSMVNVPLTTPLDSHCLGLAECGFGRLSPGIWTKSKPISATKTTFCCIYGRFLAKSFLFCKVSSSQNRQHQKTKLKPKTPNPVARIVAWRCHLYSILLNKWAS